MTRILSLKVIFHIFFLKIIGNIDLFNRPQKLSECLKDMKINYATLRPLLFRLDPELSHSLTLKTLKLLESAHWLNRFFPTKMLQPKKVWGLHFENPVGLAAGLDKNGDYIDALGTLGFGFIEIGTTTPKPQQGNPKPRLFRLPECRAIINRMGFNNKGVDYLISQVKKKRYQGILGINIGKNASTPIENAISDYLIGMQKVYAYASYITINISSPNTLGLRQLQGADYLEKILKELRRKQIQLANEFNRYVPLLIKVAPDLSSGEIKQMSDIFLAHQVDGIIATNTSLDRESIRGMEYAQEAGGLSGQPLFDRATDVLKQLRAWLPPTTVPIIASGGVMEAKQAKAKMEAGADLIQLYTGLIYSGPDLIRKCVEVWNGSANGG
jgi:dihydroorotate dehydrogenase